MTAAGNKRQEKELKQRVTGQSQKPKVTNRSRGCCVMWVASWHVPGPLTNGPQHAAFTTEAEAVAHLSTIDGRLKVAWELDDVAPTWPEREVA